MSNEQYVIMVLILSLMGIGFSYVNYKIAVCPRNNRRNWALDVGFVSTFLVALAVSMFGFHLDYMKYGLLVFLISAVIYVANKTLNHYFEHNRRRRHMCQHRAYTNGLKGIIGDGRLNKSI